MGSIRTKPSLACLKEAMLAILKDEPLGQITISELCRRAGVSRSSFYTYYQNVGQIYVDLVRELLYETRHMKIQMRCSDCAGLDKKRPFCEIVRDSEKHRGLVKDDRFPLVLVEVCRSEFEDISVGVYEDIGLSKETAFAIFCFQMMGCLAASRMVGKNSDWESVREVLDVFICGGMNAVGARSLHSCRRPSPRSS